MLDIEHYPTEDLVKIRATGHLTDADYDKAIPELEEAIEKADGALNALVELDGLKGIAFGALWKDLKFDVRHFSDFRRIAVLGRSNAEEIGTKASSLFTSADVEFFDAEEEQDSRRWAVAA
ncbi:MAG: STAS/SEC14 domain-containing protein [Roseovarius sp.]